MDVVGLVARVGWRGELVLHQGPVVGQHGVVSNGGWAGRSRYGAGGTGGGYGGAGGRLGTFDTDVSPVTYKISLGTDSVLTFVIGGSGAGGAGGAGGTGGTGDGYNGRGGGSGRVGVDSVVDGYAIIEFIA